MTIHSVIHQAFFGFGNGMKSHGIIVKNGREYEVLSKIDFSKQTTLRKVPLGEILNNLLQRLEQATVQDMELQVAHSVSNYFLNRKVVHSNFETLQNFIGRIFNYFQGYGFNTNVEIAQKISEHLKSNFQHKEFKEYLNLDTPQVSAVTYEFFEKANFGYSLLAYLKAKYASFKYRIPLLFKPFIFSDQLKINEFEYRYSGNVDKFKKQVTYDKLADINDLENNICLGSTLYTLPFDKYHEADWDDPYFKTEIKAILETNRNLSPLNLPKDKTCVALHVRKGPNDSEHNKQSFPTKYPPDSFYIESIKKVSNYYSGKPLYIQLFTDDPNPQAIADSYKAQLGDLNVTFEFRKENNTAEVHILEDWFNMSQFEVLVRPDSSFSYTAAILGNHKLIVFPESWGKTRLDNGKTVVDSAMKVKR